jgi:rhodanese-related sulfurtransferase
MTTRWIANRTLKQKLALLAVALGALAVFGDPYRAGGRVTVDTRELATIVGGELDHVSPAELAGWIVAGRTDYRLLDLRDADAYAAYHVPTAESVPVAGLPDYPLARNETIVLYSDGGIHAAQGWFLLKAEGYPGATLLRGGLDAWKDEVLFPAAPPDGVSPTPEEAAAFARAGRLAAFFGGAPRAAGAGDAGPPVVELPTVVAPPPAPAPPAAPKKKKQGC